MDEIETIARKHGVSVEAVTTLKDALQRGGGQQAQFSHRDLGGMGQWSAGGMVQVGDMFNSALKDKVNALCRELAGLAANKPGAPQEMTPKAGAASSEGWWPAGLGRPSAAGSQNGMRYACFPDSQRVAVEQGGTVTVYDSGSHRISGVAQQQGDTQTLRFTSQHGSISAADLPVAR